MENKTAAEILKKAHTYLFTKHFIFASALSRIKFSESIFAAAISFDGENLFYNPDYIIKIHENNPYSPVLSLLHCILHYVLLHPFIMPSVDAYNFDKWALSCDIVAEKIILELEPNGENTETKLAKTEIFNQISDTFKSFTAATVYKYLNSEESLDIKALKSLFYQDDHHIWYMKNKNTSNNKDGYSQQETEQNPQGSNDNKQQSLNNQQGGDSSSLDDNSQQNISENNKAKEWKEISQTAKVMMESYGHTPGANILKENIDFAHRKKYNYRDFLKKFTRLREEIKINTDEFDYIYYKLGIQLYGNIPLIEPLEYKNNHQIRNIAVAIDTSGSTQGELVKKFLTTTYDIIKTSGYFKNRFHIYIIQCDFKIQEVKVIESQREFDEYIKDFSLKGGGGTNFVPVFEYLNNFIRDLKGLIYFTDGFGEYPIKRPKYKTAFVFMNEYNGSQKVPNWAIKTVFTDEKNTIG